MPYAWSHTGVFLTPSMCVRSYGFHSFVHVIWRLLNQIGQSLGKGGPREKWRAPNLEQEDLLRAARRQS